MRNILSLTTHTTLLSITGSKKEAELEGVVEAMRRVIDKLKAENDRHNNNNSNTGGGAGGGKKGATGTGGAGGGECVLCMFICGKLYLW